jgi:hypothetical protein
MKPKFNKSHLVTVLVFLVLVPLKLSAINYTITFTGSGASTTVDSVIVQNLTKGTTVTVSAGNVLNLIDLATSLDQTGTLDESIHIYPNTKDGK